MAIRDDVLKELDSLIEEGKQVIASFRMVDMGAMESTMQEVDIQAFSTTSIGAVERIAGRDSEFYQQLPKKPVGRIGVAGYDDSYPSILTGTLMALRRAVNDGLLIRLERRVRANVYDDFLVQAKELLDGKYHVPAMVLIGGVLEDHLAKLCTVRGLSWNGTGSLAKYNDLLREKAYDQAAWRRIQAIGDIRNDAAHGKGGQVKPEDVKDAHQYVGRLLADCPA